MPRIDTAFPLLRSSHVAVAAESLRELFNAMQPDVAARHESGVARLVSARWDDALAAVLAERNFATAEAVAARVANAMGEDFDPEVMRAWIDAGAVAVAPDINASTAADIRATDEPDPVGHVFGILLTSGAVRIAQRMVTSSAGFAAHDAAEKTGAAAKVWRTNSPSPRPAHRALGGSTVAVDGSFANGMRWPGDWSGGADDVANCRCSLTIIK